ncbi:hypothetical protein BDQ17DRAFT_278269 [Cyathus striatus]|nr:hypothetical protein BDQ17DRAFT_278269 [Cyathus striatus]
MARLSAYLWLFKYTMMYSTLAILLFFIIAVHSDTLPPNNGTFVNLRVEGAKNRTIFEGLVFTTGHNVTTASGGNHHCDGTNNKTNPLPVLL